jgi:hypothetical protein
VLAALLLLGSLAVRSPTELGANWFCALTFTLMTLAADTAGLPPQQQMLAGRL